MITNTLTSVSGSVEWKEGKVVSVNGDITGIPIPEMREEKIGPPLVMGVDVRSCGMSCTKLA